MKIHIIGCSGTGKTYLAKFFSEKYSIPRFDLDDIQWDNSAESYGVKMPIEKRASLLKWTDTFQNKNLKEIKSMLKKYDEKAVRLTSKKR